MILDIRPDSPPDFDNYLAGDNREVLAALRAHAAGTLRETLVYIWGEQGTGKTHLLRAWAARVGAYSAPPLPDSPPAALALDDAQSLDDEAQIGLFNLINAARETGGRILTSAHAPPAQLNLRGDLATRLAQGLVFRLRALSDADKATAIRARADARGLRLPQDVARYLLTHCRRDLPYLLAMVDALDTYSLSHKRPVSLLLLKAMLATPRS